VNFLGSGTIDTASLLAFCGSDSGFVVRIYDQSGNARNLQQTVASQQPRIVNSGILETQLNNLPTARFSASLQNAWLNPVNYPAPPSATVFFVAGAKPMTTDGSFLQIAAGANRLDTFYNSAGVRIEDEFFSDIGATAKKEVFSSINTSAVWHRYRINHVAKTYQIRNKGFSTTVDVSGTFTANRSSGTNSVVQIGRRNSSVFLNFDFHECIVLNTDCGSAAFADLETNIQNFYLI
jgi:hypothetical protein